MLREPDPIMTLPLKKLIKLIIQPLNPSLPQLNLFFNSFVHLFFSISSSFVVVLFLHSNLKALVATSLKYVIIFIEPPSTSSKVERHFKIRPYR